MGNPNKNTNSPDVWIITEGMAGTENQCLGIAEALGVQPVIKHIGLKQPWKLLSPYLGFECAATFTKPLTPPWPDILIASGRKSIAASRYIKKQSNGKTFTVQIQDPRVNPKQFDLVCVPEHDPTRGDNVLVTKATPNRITDKRLNDAKTEFTALFRSHGITRTAVLIGGSTKSHTLSQSETEKLVESLSAIPNMMITTSRRTGDNNTKILGAAFGKEGHFFWNGQGQNPYFGILAWADFIVVTADSTSMISEAASTGKPVYVIPMQGLTNRQQALIDNLKAYGAIQDFKGQLKPYSYQKLCESAEIAAHIKEKSGLF